MNLDDQQFLERALSEGQSPMDALRSFSRVIQTRQAETRDKRTGEAPPVAPVVEVSHAALTPVNGNAFAMGFSPDRRPLDSGSSGGSSDGNFDFKVIVENASGGPTMGVLFGSVLTTDITEYSSEIAVTGLLPSIGATPTVTTSTTDVVWLEIPVTSSSFPFTFGTPVIRNLASGGNFGGGGVENDGGSPPSQTFIRKVLAVMGDDGTGKVVVVSQRVRGSLVVQLFPYLPSKDSSGGTAADILAYYVLQG